MKKIEREFFTGERPLFAERDLEIYNTIFDDGESPLKECRNISLYGSMFRWKYPLWYGSDFYLKDCVLFENARAGIWYTKNITIEDSVIEAPKTFRRCDGISLAGVSMPHAAETLWDCKNIRLDNVTANGDYFAMNCENVTVSGLTLTGNYSFDGARNVTVRDSKLLSKDAFWNSENVTVYNSFITGEYLGWNAKNLTLIDCTVESLQGLCYIEGLTVKNCRFVNTTLAFEYSTVDVEAVGTIDSVINPSGGRIRCGGIGELTLDETKINPSMTEIITDDGYIGKKGTA